jgi:cytochrome c
MKYYRLNQIAMAVLGALLLFFGAKTLIHIMFEEPEEKPGYEVPGTEAGKPAEQKPSEANELAALLAKADPAKGAEVAKKCEICHNFEKGGPNMIGPNLYGVLGRKVASHEGYDYSDALKAKAAAVGNWSYDSVSEMDKNPSAFVPGTKMALFQGLPDIKERADLLAFMRTKNDNPPPLPEVKETPKPGGEAPPPAAPVGNEFMTALAKADPKAGEADTALCKVCHTFNKGGANMVGPNLYGIVGTKIAEGRGGFNFSEALKKHEGDWTFDKLDAWLTNPAAFAPGTMMAFPGIPDVKKRANVIAYLNSNSDSPLPIPKPGAGGAEGEKGAAAPAAAPGAAPPAAAPEAAPAAPPAAAPEAAPKAETPPAAAPSAETPPAPAPEAAPSAETPPAPAPEGAPPAETKPAPEAAPSAETPPAPAPEAAPSAETPPAPAPEGAPPAETKPAPEAAPSAETPPAPAPEAAPSTETPPAPAPEAAPSAETPPAPAPEAAPSTEDSTLSNQPQPVYPNGAPEAQSETPSAPATESEPSGEDSTLSNQPQPVYPDGAPDAQ